MFKRHSPSFGGCVGEPPEWGDCLMPLGKPDVCPSSPVEIRWIVNYESVGLPGLNRGWSIVWENLSHGRLYREITLENSAEMVPERVAGMNDRVQFAGQSGFARSKFSFSSRSSNSSSLMPASQP